MSLVDWRVWLYEAITTNVGVLALIPEERWFGGGGLDVVPEGKPFGVIGLGVEASQGSGLSFQEATVKIHDEPGDYTAIRNAILAVKASIEGASKPAGAIGVLWTGDSGDLADDHYGTIFRSTSYRLAGRN